MIVAVDTRRPASVGIEVALQLEAYLENAKKLVSQCCVLGRAGAVELPYGLIVPASSSQGKTVQVVCRGRPVNGTDVSCIKMVDVYDNVYGDGFGWKYLVDATLTAIRIRDEAVTQRIAIVTTDLMLADQHLEREVLRYFAETSAALRPPVVTRGTCISLVFVEVAASAGSSTLSASDSFAAWDKLQRVRDGAKDGAYALDLISNTPAMFDSQLRCWLREFSPHQACSLRLPATETFSAVTLEIEARPYLLDEAGLVRHGSTTALHEGFAKMEVLQVRRLAFKRLPHICMLTQRVRLHAQTATLNAVVYDAASVEVGVPLTTLDQGLCRGDPLLCIPSKLSHSPPQYHANRKLFAAVCAELNGRDMGILVGLSRPSTNLQERWLLLPQAPPQASIGLDRGGSSSDGASASVQLGDTALMIRLATKEDVLEDGAAAGLSELRTTDCFVERAAACASLDVLKKGTYNPLKHSSGLFDHLISPRQGRSPRASPAQGMPPPRRAIFVPHVEETAGRFEENLRGCSPRREQQPHQQQGQRRSSMPRSSSRAVSDGSTSSHRGTSRSSAAPIRVLTAGPDGKVLHQTTKKREVNLRYPEVSPNQGGRLPHDDGDRGTSMNNAIRRPTRRRGVSAEGGKHTGGRTKDAAGRRGRDGDDRSRRDDEDMIL